MEKLLFGKHSTKWASSVWGGGASQVLATVSSFALYFKASLSNFGHICDCEQLSIIFVVKALQILKLYVLFDLACINDSYPHRYIYLLNLIPH